MRVSREEASGNRERVVATAAEKFRERGYDGISVVDLMKAAGMTHGGFYKRFASKDALMAEATELALASNLEHWRKAIARDPSRPAAALRRWYLGSGHLAAVGEGCAYAALAGEAPRHGPEIRRTFETYLQASISELTANAGDGDTDARADAMRSVAQMVGSLMLARAVDDKAFAREILESGKGGVARA